MSSKSASRNLCIDPDDLVIELALAEPHPSSPQHQEGSAASSGRATASAQAAAGAGDEATSGGSAATSGFQPQAWVRCQSGQHLVVREVQNLASLGFTGPLMILGTDILSERRAVFAFGSNALYLCP